MISNETLLHQPISIGLGWMDDSMTLNGPTEMDKNFIADTGFSPQDMQAQVDAYKMNMKKLEAAAIKAGGYTYQMISGRGPGAKRMAPSDASKCAQSMRDFCLSSSEEAPNAWAEAHNYLVNPADALANATRYTSEFLVSRSPYSWIGYSWLGCDGTDWPRPALWDVDYGGEPEGPCKETGANTNVFLRKYPNATVQWDCNQAKGTISMSNGTTWSG
eukprot:m.138994 g.138994  ORF g.138994 m.138994 type:complete len:217 (-) comp14787_c0_seq1:17-667(-)